MVGDVDLPAIGEHLGGDHIGEGPVDGQSEMHPNSIHLGGILPSDHPRCVWGDGQATHQADDNPRQEPFHDRISFSRPIRAGMSWQAGHRARLASMTGEYPEVGFGCRNRLDFPLVPTADETAGTRSEPRAAS